MSIVKYNPFKSFRPLNINHFLDDFSGRSMSEFFDAEFISSVPSVNVLEKDNSYEIQVAAPGVAKEDIQIEIEKDQLVISAKGKDVKEDVKEGKYSRREFNYNSFKRSFHLSDNIDRDNISANYESGILSISLGKLTKSDLKTTVEIK